MSDVLHIRHGLHIDPALWRGDHQIRPAKPQGRQKHHRATVELALLAEQILARDAEMNLSGGEGGGDIPCRGEANLNHIKALTGGRIAARAAHRVQWKATVGQPRLDLLLEPPF